ncbi:MAG: hypothetical protein EZS28_048501, partial [Streblomastix strix]
PEPEGPWPYVDDDDELD